MKSARSWAINVLNNVWIPDGMKDVPADRLGPRMRLKASLDEIFAEKLPNVIDCVESKVFGIGLESYTVGSNEFYMSYAGTHPGVYNLLDNGHYHPTEVVSDKIPALLCFFDKIPLHVTRPVRWDSDHVVAFDDELKEIMKEIVRNDALDRVLIGLDFFDASINRVAAWIIGTRNAEKALLWALLQPNQQLKALQDAGKLYREVHADGRSEDTAVQRYLGGILPARRRSCRCELVRGNQKIRAGSSVQALKQTRPRLQRRLRAGFMKAADFRSQSGLFTSSPLRRQTSPFSKRIIARQCKKHR